MHKLCGGVKPNLSGISYSSLSFFFFPVYRSQMKNKHRTKYMYTCCDNFLLDFRPTQRWLLHRRKHVIHLAAKYQCMFVRTLHYFVEAKKQLVLRENCSLCVEHSLQSVSRLILFLTLRLVVYRKAHAFGLSLFLTEVQYTVY